MIDFVSTTIPVTKVKVPGKVIISGEHAVVYGAPALACAIKKYAFASVTRSEVVGVHLLVAEFGIDQHFIPSQLIHISQQIQFSHQQYLRGLCPLSDVVSSPKAFFSAALGASGLVDILPNDHGLSIELTMDLVAGSGMGSSAALVAAMLAACFKHIGQPLSDAELIVKTTQSEHWQHGRSSGLDPYVCVMGGLQQYQNGQGAVDKSLLLRQLAQCFLITTGKPESSTGQCVEFVKQQNNPQTLWQKFCTVQEDLLKALMLNQHRNLLGAIRSTHQLLCHIAVVPGQVNEFIASVEALNGAAKICGAGSVSGVAGGLVLAVGADQKALAHLCLNYGYGMQELHPDLAGVSYGGEH